MNFTVDDIKSLVIEGPNRMDKTDEYDISFYENYLRRNLLIIEELIKNLQNSYNLIKDEKVKDRVLYLLTHYLGPAYEMNRKREPRKDFQSGKYPSPSAGYFSNHKYAFFIERDLRDLKKSYSLMIDFMNKIYELYLVSSKKSLSDSAAVNTMFVLSKYYIQDLGVYSGPEYLLRSSLCSNPNAMWVESDIIIDEENSSSSDIMIDSIPYYVTLPVCSANGADEVPELINRPKIMYNQLYYDKHFNQRNL